MRLATQILILLMIAALPLAAQFSSSPKRKKNRVQPVDVGGIASGPVTIDTVNDRWAGQRALIRIESEVGKGKDNQGWSYSGWAKAPKLPGEPAVEFRLGVSNRELLLDEGYLYRRKTIRAGTAFVVSGWSLSQPEKDKGLQLHLQFDGVPVDAVLELKKDKLDDLEDSERAMRIQIFQLTGAQQPRPAMSAAPTLMPAAPQVQEPPPLPSADSAPLQPSEPESSAVFRPSVEVVAVSVSPAEVQPGGEVSLVVHYKVAGLPPGYAYEVAEKRRILVDGKQAAVFETPIEREVGAFTSSQAMKVPANASGFYTLEATVTLAGIEATGTAFFRVTGP